VRPSPSSAVRVSAVEVVPLKFRGLSEPNRPGCVVQRDGPSPIAKGLRWQWQFRP
jgi:hypothetical protein